MPSPRPTDRVRLAVELLTALSRMKPTVSASELADALGWPPGRQAALVRALTRAELVESWPDPGRLGSTRVMLSAGSLRLLGISLAPRGDRWELDRAMAGSIRPRFRRR
jgi:DNA-binding IclR family transcriptional regulator